MFPPQEHIDGAQGAEKVWRAKSGHRVWTSATLGQVAIESAFLRAQSGVNNYGGIKANAAEIAAGKFRKCLTTERINGVDVRVLADFASYPNLTAFYMAHGRVIATYSGYRAGWAAKTADEYLAGIAHPYATAKKEQYIGAVKGVMDHYGLRKFDLLDADLSAPAPKATALAHPAIKQGAIPAIAAAAGAAVATPDLHLPWPIIGAAALVAGVVGLLVYLDRRKVAAAVAHAASVPAMTIDQVHAYVGLPPLVPAAAAAAAPPPPPAPVLPPPIPAPPPVIIQPPPVAAQ